MSDQPAVDVVFVATCPRCPWSTTSQTRRVVEQRLREHEEGCK